MNKNDEKKIDLNELNSIESEFSKTTFGKFMRVIVIMAMIAIAVGLIIGVFEAIVYAKSLDVNKYKTVIDFGKNCAEYGGKSIAFSILFYVWVLPVWIGENKNKDDKLGKKSKRSSKTLILVMFALCMGVPMLNLVIEIFNLIW